MKFLETADRRSYQRMTTSELRESHLIDGMFVPGGLTLCYTDIERSILNMQDGVVVTNNYTKGVFVEGGVDVPVHVVHLGLDKWFTKLDNQYLTDCITFSLIGKLESRKNTLEILRAFAKTYGGNMKYRLHCLITNPFFDQGAQQNMINSALDGLNRDNIIFYPRLGRNSELNDFINAADIDLSGLSSAEGWNIPAFTSTCLGKYSVVSNNTAHKEWATEGNTVLVETEGMRPCYDNIHFHHGHPFNQGEFPVVTEEAMVDGIERAVAKFEADKVNKAGLETADKFTYASAYSQIRDILS